ncbi:hypothetical protein [Gynuella sp.]|uniref:hypothetical protein n=1 Tax=Gynuella sp. TaxID=2969146 RepID=UPI003D0BDBF3
MGFESVFDRIAMATLLIQVLTGIHLTDHLWPDYRQWHPPKLTRLLITALLALDARFQVMINNQKTAWEI